MSSSAIAPAALELALRIRADLRVRPNGSKQPPSWEQVARELAQAGHGRLAPFHASDLAAACAAAPIELHPLAPAQHEQLLELERSWRDGWAEDFPGEPWPGLDEARRLLRSRYMGGRR